MPSSAKVEIILQYLYDHARLVCDELNRKSDSTKWCIVPLTDTMRHNIIFHYGTGEFNEEKKQQTKQHPEFEHPIDPETVIENEKIAMLTRKKPKPRLTIKRQVTSNRMFGNVIQSQQIRPARVQKSPSNKKSVSASSIYIANSPESDYERALFEAPSDLDMASMLHSQWFKEHSFVQPVEDDSTWNFGSLAFQPPIKPSFKIHSQPF